MKRRVLSSAATLTAGVLLASLGAAVAWACSCLPYPDDPREAAAQAWSQSAAILAGTVVAVSSESVGDRGTIVRATIAVARRWKGPTGDRFVVETADSSAACGYPFQANQQYLIAATRDELSGAYHTGLCSLTRPLEEARDLVRALDARAAAK